MGLVPIRGGIRFIPVVFIQRPRQEILYSLEDGASLGRSEIVLAESPLSSREHEQPGGETILDFALAKRVRFNGTLMQLQPRCLTRDGSSCLHAKRETS